MVGGHIEPRSCHLLSAEVQGILQEQRTPSLFNTLRLSAYAVLGSEGVLDVVEASIMPQTRLLPRMCLNTNLVALVVRSPIEEGGEGSLGPAPGRQVSELRWSIVS